MKSDSAAITAICGSANSITGFSQAVSGSPAPNQITISESRQLRVMREQHRDEHGERKQHRQRAEREEAEKREHRVGRELAARGLAEQPDEPRGHRDGKQRHEHGARETCELPQQRAVEDHVM